MHMNESRMLTTTSKPTTNRNWSGYGRSKGDFGWLRVRCVYKYDYKFYLGCYNVLSMS